MACAETPAPQGQLPPEINLFGDEILNETPGAEVPAAVAPAGAVKKSLPFPHTLTFADGHLFHGELIAVTEDTVVWRRPDVREPMRLPRAKVQRIDFLAPFLFDPEILSEALEFEAVEGPLTQDEPAKSAVPATVKLGGADWLFGRITSSDGRNFALQMEDGIRLPLVRSRIEWLYFDWHPAPGFGYTGSALDLDRWRPPGVRVEVDGSTAKMVGTRWCGYVAPTPKRFEVSFELPAECEDTTRLWLQPRYARVDDFEPGTVKLLFSNKEISRQITNDGNGLQTVPLPLEARDDKGPPSYHIFYDGYARRIHVWRNGREIGDWTLGSGHRGIVGWQSPLLEVTDSRGVEDPSGIAAVCFERANPPGPLSPGMRSPGPEFNRLRVQPWNGILPGHETRGASLDILSRKDAAPITGKLGSIDDHSLVISGKREQQRGAFVQFPDTPAPLAGAEAKLRLRHGILSARRLAFRDGRMRCETALPGALDVPANALRTILFSGPSQSAPLADNVLVFKNGDEFVGKAVSASLSGSVRWKSVYGPDFEFASAAIAGIRLAAGGGQSVAAPARAELRTGEEICGRIIGFDEHELKLQHEWLGVFTLNRDRLARLLPNAQLQILDGAGQPEEWMRPVPTVASLDGAELAAGRQSWTYLDGTYALNPAEDADVALARRLPPKLERFEVRAENRTPYFSPGLEIEFLSNGGRIFDASAGGGGNQTVVVMNSSGRHHTREIPFEEAARRATKRCSMRLFVDLKAGTLCVVFDGQSMGHYQWEKEERKSEAITVRFRPIGFRDMTPGAVSANILSEMWIGPWTGEVPKAGAPKAPATILANGDVNPGAPRNLRDGEWTIESALGAIKVPAEKVLAIDFGSAPIAEPVAGRIRLRDGTKLDVDRFAWDGRILSAHSGLLGEFEVPAESVAEFIYHPARFRPPIDEEPQNPFARDPDKIPMHDFGNLP
jgi:hypothetical protein